MPASIFDTSRMLRLPTSRSPVSSGAGNGGMSDFAAYDYDRIGHHTKRRGWRCWRPAGGLGTFSIGWKEVGIVGLVAALGFLLFKWMVETHIQIAFYQRGWVHNLLPERPPALDPMCFSRDYLASPWIPQPGGKSFPSSPDYNLTAGSLGLQPKVLSLSPGFDLPHHDDCYAFSRTLPTTPLPAMAATLPSTDTSVIHVYWRSDLAPISERQIITLKSILATQDFSPLDGVASNANLQAGDVKTHVILWTNPSLNTPNLLKSPLLEPLLTKYPERLSVIVLDLTDLAKGTPMEGHPKLEAAFDTRAWLDGDLVRVLVLWRYGGYWVDMDDLLTRDLRVLGEHEWVVMWDCYDKPYEPLNGHIMHFLRQSPYLCEMLSVMANGPAPRPASTDWGQHLYHRVFRSLIHAGVTPFKVLPFCLTDGRSCTLKDRLPDPFATKAEEEGWRWKKEQWEEVERRAKGVFAVHLHNQWSKSFAEGGWVRRILLEPWERTLAA